MDEPTERGGASTSDPACGYAEASLDGAPSPSDELLREAARAPALAPRVGPAGRAGRARERIGATVGKYRVTGLVGAGGMGIVYRAEDTALRRDVALKVLPADRVGDPEHRRRFLREARNAAGVSHANVAAVYDAGEAGGDLFIAMELVRGRSLRELLDERAFSIEEVVRLGRQICRGLGRAHELGVIHRDLKPDNLVIDGDGTVKILDFGLSKIAPSGSAPTLEVDAPSSVATEAGRVLGTPGYMSPEQAKGRPVDARGDVFALGVTLFELAAGRRPFPGSGLEAIIAADRDDAPRLDALVAGAPPALADVIARCLEKDPARRFAGGSEVGSALAAVDDGDLARAPAEAPRQPRSRVWIGASLLAAAALATSWIAAGRPGARRVEPPTAAMANPLRAAKAVLACPILVSHGVEAPAGWLGAAAAHLACDRAAIMLGDDPRRTLVPAELLDLPRVPTASFPADPFGEPGARERSLAAATTRAEAYLDGEIGLADGAFTITLELRSAGGAPLGHATATDAHFVDAVASALDALGERGAIPIAAAPSEEIAEWTPKLGVRARVGAGDAAMRISTGTEIARGCAWYEQNAADIGPIVLAGGRATCPSAPRPDPGSAAPIDHASGRAILTTLTPQAVVGHEAELAGELAAAFDQEPSALGRASLAMGEASLRFALGDNARARERALVALGLGVRNGDAWTLATFATEGADAQATAVAAACWRPWFSDAWNTLSRADVTGAVGARLPGAQRAYLLAPRADVFAVGYAEVLLHAGRLDDARAVGLKLSADPATEIAGRSVLIRARASEGHFAEALGAYQQLMIDVDPVRAPAAWYRALALSRELATILGASEAFGEWYAARFVAPAIPKIRSTDQYGVFTASATCLLATRPTAKRCLARIQELLDHHYFVAGFIPAGMTFFAGAKAYLAGDRKAALEAWRPIGKRVSLMGQRLSYLLAPVFDEAGEPDVAERIDAYDLAHVGEYGGASLGMLHAARRAAKTGDAPRALDLARRVMNAWSGADATVPAVDEMRKLVRELEKKAQAGAR